MEDEVTLASLPMSTTWRFPTTDLGILCVSEEPLTIHLYGVVVSANLCGFRTKDTPTTRIRPWSVEDGERAAMLFPQINAGTSNITLLRVMNADARHRGARPSTLGVVSAGQRGETDGDRGEYIFLPQSRAIKFGS